MADVTIDELIERTRLESGLRNNAYYDPTQILKYLNAGGAELQDLFTAANQHYVIDEFDFTTTGPSDAVVALPDNFQQGHSLDIYPDTPGQTRTVRYLSNWLDRNKASGAAYILATGGTDPVYTFMGGNLRFYPPQVVPAAPFRLYYTPTWNDLVQPITVEFEIAGDDTPSVPPVGSLTGSGSWALLNSALNDDIPTDGTVDMNLDFEAPNTGFSGAYPIVDIGLVSEGFGRPTMSCDNLVSIFGFTGPAAGTGTYTYQPIGTRAALPSMFAPWSEYLVVYSAIAVNTDRQRGTGELERKLQALKARIASILDNRQEEPTQPPLTRGTGGNGWWSGGGWDGGGWL